MDSSLETAIHVIEKRMVELEEEIKTMAEENQDYYRGLLSGYRVCLEIIKPSARESE